MYQQAGKGRWEVMTGVYVLALIGLFFLGYHGYGFIQDVRAFMIKTDRAMDVLLDSMQQAGEVEECEPTETLTLPRSATDVGNGSPTGNSQ